MLIFGFLNLPYLWAHLQYVVQSSVYQDSPGVPSSAGLGPNMLKFERLGILAPITEPNAENEPAFQQALQNGVARHPASALVGEPGNAFIFGHSSDLPWAKGRYKTVFAILTKAQAGDIIIATDKAGNAFVYTVEKTFVTAANDASVLAPPGDGGRILTLQTSYPLGTAWKRWIVVARME